MAFDVSKVKPGWSLSKVKRYLPEEGGCPLRFARLDIEQRWDEEPKGDAAGTGIVLAAMMAKWREIWLLHGADASGPHVTLEEAAARAAREEGVSREAHDKALELFFDAIPREYGARLRPPRDQVSRYWIEERIALTKDWKRLPLSPQDAKFWGSREQRAKTWFRFVPDFAWLDVDGVLHVEDDKALWGKVDQRQVQAYAFGFGKLLEAERIPVEGIRCRYNLIGQGKVLDVAASELEDVAGFPRWLEAAVGRILGDAEFAPNVGKSCDWCGFVAECPAHLKTAGELQAYQPEQFRPPATLEEAQRLGLWILTGEAVLSAAKKAARAWVEQHGPVALPATDKELRLNPSTEWEGSARDALNAIGGALLDQGAEPEEARARILELATFRWGQVETITKKLWPYSGKGVTGEVKAANRAAREPVEAAVRAAGTETARQPTFGVFGRKEAA